MPHDVHRDRLVGALPTGEPKNPHELLGLDPDEDNPIKIIEAAKRRLALLRESQGSEVGLKRSLATEIMAARAAMLARAQRVDRPHREPLTGSANAIQACAGSATRGGD